MLLLLDADYIDLVLKDPLLKSLVVPVDLEA